MGRKGFLLFLSRLTELLTSGIEGFGSSDKGSEDLLELGAVILNTSGNFEEAFLAIFGLI